MCVKKLAKLLFELDLPRGDFVLFGVLCPYCGKTDRIRLLEAPEDLEGELAEEQLAAYKSAWEGMRPQGPLAICKFCVNLLSLDEELKVAAPLVEP